MTTITVRTIIEGLQVWVNGERLDIEPSRLINNHSKDFSWGYAGSGPSQTALAICLHTFGPYIAPEIYQHFKFDHVQHWHRWDDGERLVNIEKFYLDYIEGRTIERALSRFSQNVYDRLFAALEDVEAATDLIAESSVVNEGTQTRIVTDAYSPAIERAADAMGLSYVNLDGRWNIVGLMPSTKYLKELMATAKKCLQV